MAVDDHVAWPDYIDIRLYEGGFTIRFWLFLIRWNRQHAYTSLEFSKMRNTCQWQGGLTFKEFKAQQKAMRLEKAEARAKAESKGEKL